MRFKSVLPSLAFTLAVLASPASANTRVDDFLNMESLDRGEIIATTAEQMHSLAAQNGRYDVAECISGLFNSTENPNAQGYDILVHDIALLQTLAINNPEVLDQMPVERILFRIVERECIQQDTAGTEPQPTPAPH